MTLCLLSDGTGLSESRKLYQIKAFIVTVSMCSAKQCEAQPWKGLSAGHRHMYWPPSSLFSDNLSFKTGLPCRSVEKKISSNIQKG